MNNHSHPHKRKNKDNAHLNQLRTIFQYLQINIATASMVTAATGVPQKKLCKKTGFKAWYLTTDKDNAPKHLLTQLNLF